MKFNFDKKATSTYEPSYPSSQGSGYPDETQRAAERAVLAESDARSRFIALTYAHLFGAVLVFAALLAGMLQIPGIEGLVMLMIGNKLGWLAILGGFMIVSMIADNWASSPGSSTMQYLGLGLYVVAEAILFVPLVYIAAHFYPGAIHTAGLMTGVIFTGLTGFVMLTRHDFSFLRGVLCVASLAALGVIVCSAIFGFHLGVIFIGVMIALAAGYILYDTSNVLHHYHTDQHVAASLALFASVALMFWYILQLVMSLQSRSSSDD